MPREVWTEVLTVARIWRCERRRTHEIDKQSIYGPLITRVEENVISVPPGNFTSDFHLWSTLGGEWPLRWRGAEALSTTWRDSIDRGLGE